MGQDAARFTIPGLETYFGGKNGAGTYQAIINQLPPCQLFVEGCIGTGAITRHMRPAARNLGFDMDTKVVRLWNEYHGDLHQVEVTETDVLDWLEKNAGGPLDVPETLIYLDPPYPLDSRKSPRLVYLHEWTDEQHERSLQAVQQWQAASIVLSTYENEIYRSMLGPQLVPPNATWQDWKEYPNGWRMVTFQSITRRGMATEQLWLNFPNTGVLHDYQYLGHDYRERERIKKKVKRHVERLRQLPVAERNAILSAIAEFASGQEHVPPFN